MEENTKHGSLVALRSAVQEAQISVGPAGRTPGYCSEPLLYIVQRNVKNLSNESGFSWGRL